jgi:hypothetical protein
MQQRTGCSDATCKDVIATFRRYLRVDVPNDFRGADKKMKDAAGTKVLRLNGCVGCNKHVFMPEDKATSCPLCGHARYDRKGKPHEVNSFCYLLFLLLFITHLLVTYYVYD